MPVTLEQIPRDESGVVVGSFRLRHRDPGFSEGLDAVAFEHGVTTTPVSGLALQRIVGGMGDDLVSIEPWLAGDEPEPVTEDEDGDDEGGAEQPDDDEEQLPEEPEPVTQPDPEPPPASLGAQLPDDREALFAIAHARGVQTSEGWGIKRLKRAIQGAEPC